MHTFFATAVFSAAIVASVMARVTPPTDGNILACHGQGCDNCPVATSVNAGEPTCLVYNSADVLGQSFAAKGGNGYEVWWDSGPADPTCKIIVRTPASTDLPACGYYLTSWSQAGCYYTFIQQTFMLQFCCGSGDCEAASPARSVRDARLQARSGNTTMVSLMLGSMESLGESGKRSIEGVGEIGWRHTPAEESPVALDAETPAPAEAATVSPKIQAPAAERRAADDVGGDCVFHPAGGKVTEGYKQYKASDTNTCNTSGGCSETASVAVTEGYSTSPTLTGNFYGVISAAVGYTFTKSMTYTATNTFTQGQGTTGYMSYIPTYNCWHGTFENCAQTVNGNVQKLDPSQTYYACTPALRSNGEGDGTFSFVYVQ
jgi:hypothetical protein